MEHKIKLNAYLIFDDAKEKDLIEKVEKLIDSRQLSYFVTNLLKFGLENPDILQRANLETNRVMTSASRNQFFDSVKKELAGMSERIDKIQDIALKEYELALLGKELGLYEKSENILRAQFLINRQLNELSKSLGVSSLEFNSLKSTTDIGMGQLEDKAEELVEFAIQHYDGVLGEVVAERNTVGAIREDYRPTNGSSPAKTVEKAEVVTVEKHVNDAIKEVSATIVEPPKALESSNVDTSNFNFDEIGDFFGG